MIEDTFQEQFNYDKFRILNDIILNAVIHGSDIGGSYSQNYDNLTESMKEYLMHENIDEYYEIKNKDVEFKGKVNSYFDGIWEVPQFVRKDDK